MSDNNPAEPIRTGSTSDESINRRTDDEGVTDRDAPIFVEPVAVEPLVEPTVQQPVVVDPITGAGRNSAPHVDADHSDSGSDNVLDTARATAAHSSEPTIVEPTDEPPVSTATAETPIVTSARATPAEPIAATDNPSAVDTRSQYIVTTPAAELDEPGSPAPAPTATWQPAEHPTPSPASRVVYVEAPTAPAKKSNRGFGVGVALLSTLIYTVLFALLIVGIFYLTYGTVAFSFLTVRAFIVPIIAFVVAFVLLVLLLNRANRWAYLVGSLVVGLFVYFVTIGVLLLLANIVAATPAHAQAEFAQALINPVVIASALLAREVTLWAGLIISARGRRIKDQNAEARATFDRESSVARADGRADTAAPVA
ncbi:hypothetical protein [Glaciihabitans sp. dw_435]|uniref:hypothetical protein n=1 Tax=Glaciihabitans sp. dw_435 TaxID=2720081 RepID=UPI001BD5A17E|nr:hypothetical protein [Glaciihabitans sp. dw_435]